MYVEHVFSPATNEKSPRLRAEVSGVIQAIRSGVDKFQSLFRKAIREPDKTRTYLKDREHFSTEVGFLEGRKIDTHRPQERLEACDLLAIEQFPLDRILNATSKEESLRLHEEATYLRNIYHSQIVTLELADRKKFEELRGLPLIESIRFLTEKVYLCYTQGIEINKENYQEYLLDDAELRLERIKRDIGHLLKEASMIGADAPTAFSDFKAAVSSLASEGLDQKITYPTEAPELYKDREKRDFDGVHRKEKPDEFVRRVYKKWLHQVGGLPRPVLRDLDEPCYRALYKSGFPDDFETLLPTAQGRAVEHIARSDTEMMAAIRETRRKADSKRRGNKPTR
ncbi:hypothetical protein [Tateyamaria sp.]|uniref:hypothetical protein n=1 Tax=Tateyamaria sp. TaxID=1929288 RepID=UPI00329EF941